jgi:hypothetical protein
MTKEEWLTASEPHAMLEFLQKSGKVSERKLRLFAVACSRRIWSLIDAPGRTAVEVAERFAEGLAGPEELRAARLACQGAHGQASWYAAATNPEIAARNAALSAQAGARALVGADTEELVAQARLVREIYGDAFKLVTVEASWLTPGVVELAQAIYQGQTFDKIPELADALEQAGCHNQEILNHCRRSGQHVRGCWGLDLILGNE